MKQKNQYYIQHISARKTGFNYFILKNLSQAILGIFGSILRRAKPGQY